jgi:ribose transport system substrate-binding protein
VTAKGQDWFPASSPKGSLVKGKHYWIIALTTAIPTIADYANGFKNAGKALGADVTVFDGQGTPTGAVQGVNDAVAAHADGIVTVLIDPRSIASAVGNADAANIPIIEADSGPPFPPFQSGVSAAAAQNQVLMGSWESDAALQLTNCNLHAIVITTPGNIAADATDSGIHAEIKKLCPTACTAVDLDIQPNGVATQTAGDVENALRLHPDTNAVIQVADVFEPYTATGMTAVGSKVPVITTSSMGDLAGTGGPNNPVAADVVYAPGLAHGWFYMQAVLNLASGQKDPSVLLPLGMVMKSNSSATDPSSYAGASPYAELQATFGKLWSVSG